MLAIVAIKCGLLLLVLLGFLVPAASWIERKQSALMQDRVGANRAEISGARLAGLLHPLADLVKLVSKQDLVPEGASRALFELAPWVAVIPGIAAFAVIPFAGVYPFADESVSLVAADIDWGLLHVLLAAALASFGAVLAGWSSNHGGARLGAVRGAAQVVSYAAPLGLSAVGVFLVFGSVKLTDMVVAQDTTLRLAGVVEAFGVAVPGWAQGFPFTIPSWGIVLQPLGFLLFLTCVLAQQGRPPFDSSESGGELAGGYRGEYTGLRGGLFDLADLLGLLLIACLLTSIFFGGWAIPWLSTDAILGGLAPFVGEALATIVCVALHLTSFLVKVLAMVWLQLLIRGSLPRVRYDQLMDLCWKRILPLSLANVFLTASAMVLVGAVG